MSIEYWNDQAPTWARNLEEGPDLLLEVLDEFDVLTPDSTVLDIGCGPGWHLGKMAPHIAEGYGFDISSAMIGATPTSKNLTFYTHDWSAGIPEPLTGRTFSAVIANRSPGVNTIDDVAALMRLSSRWCVVNKPTYRSTSLLEQALRDAGVVAKPFGGSLHVDWLISQGYLPQLRYQTRVRSRKYDAHDVSYEAERARAQYGDEVAERMLAALPGEGVDKRIDVTLTMAYALAIWRVDERQP
ncbi:class I SAM-dependent methyltransferase [Corynebacterium sp. HMSC08D02]|uniref:class I SAM-dependent methyltransferase n=1 Tax=Corynebacterium sp. HMSC08D02 TaxID=1581138 RepID=UPI0008A12E71|nr:class I SAM-dependent methyltransferase [Corynebacterium sp. HMSC08D02]OFT29643.1 hypothetical protein HMPREF3170_06285 [Corynebacterium sp. HMSC08D02]